jgi:hypothetical protein
MENEEVFESVQRRLRSRLYDRGRYFAAARSRHASLPQIACAFSKRVSMALRERRHLLLLISILVLFMLSPFVVTLRHGVFF